MNSKDKIYKKALATLMIMKAKLYRDYKVHEVVDVWVSWPKDLGGKQPVGNIRFINQHGAEVTFSTTIHEVEWSLIKK